MTQEHAPCRTTTTRIGNFPRAAGEEDVEGHGRSPEAGPESTTRIGNFPRAAGEEDETPGQDGVK